MVFYGTAKVKKLSDVDKWTSSPRNVFAYCRNHSATLRKYFDIIGNGLITTDSFMELKPGDILIETNHVEIYAGKGKINGKNAIYVYTWNGLKGSQLKNYVFKAKPVPKTCKTSGKYVLCGGRVFYALRAK